MATIERFEDIEAWQLARELTKEVYAVSKQGSFAKDYGLRDQIRRAAVSVMSNIAEGYERSGNREFSQFLALAKGSSAEVRAQLYVALDQKYIEKSKFDSLTDISIQISKMLAGLIRYLRKSELKGTKYK